MLTLIIVAAGGFLAGSLIRSAFHDASETRCGQGFDGRYQYKNENGLWEKKYGRCTCRKDPRCMGGSCTKHCKELCDGKCLNL